MKYPKFASFASLFIALVVLCPVAAHSKDDWLQVRSKNFFLVGNASEKDIRRVATKMEQFRETFRQVFRTVNLTSSIPTNVVVFKSDSAFKPYKPKRADGKTDNFLAGYFQPGEDVNYIAVSTEGPDAETFGTIFHEYVHFIVDTNFGKSDVPAWFNEGLAEYYQTFEIEGDQKAKLGYPQGNHLELLRQNKLLPLETLFKVTHYSLRENGNHSRSVFYAQSWALIHYLIQTGKTDGLDKFLKASFKNTDPEKAFQEAFQITYADMEKELRKYVSQASYQYNNLIFKEKLVFDTEMRTAPLSEADSKTYLADLLYHTNRADEAEPLLAAALAVNPGNSMANTTLGMVKVRQRKWDEARAAFEKALAQDQTNHLAYYQYAYLLSRENRDEFGYVRSFPSATAQKMREMLKKAIALNPGFTESYELFAFVNVVNNENHDESLAYLKKALQYQPGKHEYLLRAAEIYLRQDKFKEAEPIITKVAASADDPQIKQRAVELQNQLRQRAEMIERNREAMRQYDEMKKNGGRAVILTRGPAGKPPTPEELEKLHAEANLKGINGALRKPSDGELRVIGNVGKITCVGPKITYSVKTDSETFTLTSKDFQQLELNSFVAATNNVDVGCDASLASLRSVITYRPAQNKTGSRGDLIALEFVPQDFRFVDPGNLNEVGPQLTEMEETSSGTSGQGFDKEQSDAMMDAVRNALRKPGDGERRVLGTLDKIECDKKGVNFLIRSASESLKLVTSNPQALLLRSFTGDMSGMQFGCGTTGGPEVAVFSFKVVPDAKAKSAGEILSIEYVPKTFVLEK
ncbi:MAG TPA: tetratricopeptide repeat protein [Pyrinomonadaceae bacterium]|nr:tetratricopeptide repeat protein [Pyrinomonadaceae bacterium]